MSPARARTRTARSGVERTNHEATVPPTKKETAPKNNMAQNYRKGSSVRVQLHTAAGVPLKNWLEVGRVRCKEFSLPTRGEEKRVWVSHISLIFGPFKNPASGKFQFQKMISPLGFQFFCGCNNPYPITSSPPPNIPPNRIYYVRVYPGRLGGGGRKLRCLWPPFVSLFLHKQSITGGKNDMTIW